MNIDAGIKVAAISFSGLEVNSSSGPFEQLLLLAAHYKEAYSKTTIGDVPGVQEARKLFRAINLDPTKHRPSSEALLRRALKNKTFHKINSLVDIGNWCSLDFLLPICVYDLDKILGSVTIRLGKDDESYLAHNDRIIRLLDRYVLADDSGPFGSPITDSVRTAVDESTINSLLVIFAPADIESSLLTELASKFSQRVGEYCGGKTDKIEILTG
ncbi:B3/4 domain-containing protein [Candidatus Cloacimonadota bacterium]